ncbi:lysozyme [Qipengyuania aurantiaca]|uniref:Lysozyme n=2 Tax=Qipengyuania aurantiaca TaxID=2867233 RepID=A0ABX8ZQI9_9SPHN|nr:lysozyme [Qipengyuania aurantiaca]
MGAGAMSLAAFTGPPTQKAKPTVTPAVTISAVEMEEVRKPAALLTASDEFKQALIEEEGVRYTVYRDVAGYPTVGVGHLIRPADNLRVGDRISDEQVLAFLEDDLKTAERGVRILVGDLPLYQHEFDALLDLVYNVGLGNVSDRESPRLNAAINAADYEGIAAELDYTHAAGKVARGLEFRSERRAKIFMEASYEDPREVSTSRSVSS